MGGNATIAVSVEIRPRCTARTRARRPRPTASDSVSFSQSHSLCVSELLLNFSQEHVLSLTKKKSSSSLRCTEMKHFVEIPFSMLLKSERKGENRLCDCALRPKRCLEMGKPHTRPTLPPLYPLLACGLHLALNLTLTISYAQQKKKKDRGREREGERAQDLTEITLKPLLSTCFSPEPAWRA